MRLNELIFSRCSFLLGAFALLISTATGCGGKGTVSGTVTLDGKPLPAGRIVFVPSQGTAVDGDIKDGQYTIAGVPPGDATVTVDTTSIKERIDALAQAARQSVAYQRQPPPGTQLPEGAKEALAEEKRKEEETAQQLKELMAAYRAVPEKYGKAEESPLTVPVKAGSSTFNVSLSSK